MRRLLLLVFFACPTPAFAQGAPAQGAPAQGMHTLDMMSDSDAAAMYRLKNGEVPKTAAETSPSGSSQGPQDTKAPDPRVKSEDQALTPKTLVITPDQPVDKPETSPTSSSPGPKDNKQPDPPPKPEDSSLEKAHLWPRSKLSRWDDGYLITMASTPDQITKALTTFELNAERANPQDLMDIATLYASKNQLPLAARYYYAAQLRHAFDIKRFPIKPVRALQGDSLSAVIGGWAVQSSGRIAEIALDVQKWDAQTPYHYRPHFPLPDPDQNTGVPAESDWPEMLEKTRTRFFADLADISSALKRMGK